MQQLRLRLTGTSLRVATALLLATLPAQAQQIAPIQQAVASGAGRHFVLQRCAGLMAALAQAPGQPPEAQAQAAQMAQAFAEGLLRFKVETAGVDPERAQRSAEFEIRGVATLYRNLFPDTLVPTAKTPAHPTVQMDRGYCTQLAAAAP